MRKLTLLLASWLTLPSAWALGVEQAFSATAIQQSPDQPLRQARMFVTPDKVRMEFRRGDQAVVEITDLKEGSSMVLLPERKWFAQQPAAPAVMQQLQQAKRPATPCAAKPQAKCKKVGRETLFGRPTDKWEMVVEHQGRSYRSLYWIDTQRFMPLRQMWADGTVVELHPKGSDTFDSRAAERWQMVTQHSDGRKFTADQWYDPELDMVIAESLPDGHRRELRDIVVAPQDPALFRVPAGYRQVSASALTQQNTKPTPR